MVRYAELIKDIDIRGLKFSKRFRNFRKRYRDIYSYVNNANDSLKTYYTSIFHPKETTKTNLLSHIHSIISRQN